MELKLVILSLACLSCLVPPAYSTFLSAELAAAGAAKGAAVVGAGILAKGAVLKGAALLAALAAKGALLGGAALLGAKALKAAVALKAGAALAHAKPALLPTAEEEPSLVQKSVLVHRPVYVQKHLPVHKPILVEVPQPSVVLSPPSPSKIVDRFHNLLSVSADAVTNKTAAFGQLLASLLPRKTVVNPPQPLVYRIISTPKFYPVPLFEKLCEEEK